MGSADWEEKRWLSSIAVMRSHGGGGYEVRSELELGLRMDEFQLKIEFPGRLASWMDCGEEVEIVVRRKGYDGRNIEKKLDNPAGRF